MRLWHKDLIAVLPDNQLRGQWRECCLIAKGLHDGTLNHLLVNKVKNYSSLHFITYTGIVYTEMRHRGMMVRVMSFTKHLNDDDFRVFVESAKLQMTAQSFNHFRLFEGWHDDRYFRQCYYNLQEKYDSGGITEDEWQKIEVVAHDRV